MGGGGAVGVEGEGKNVLKSRNDVLTTCKAIR